MIAEIVANSYDADATVVKISAPMGEWLASKVGGVITDKGFKLEVVDDGVGMSPDQVNDFYLRVGAERRKDAKRGDRSKKFKRKVMGRKGVGKLAPFGVCRFIEVISSGGDRIDAPGGGKGFRTAHLILDRDAIMSDTDGRTEPTLGNLDETIQPKWVPRYVLAASGTGACRRWMTLSASSRSGSAFRRGHGRSS